jgi:hypothetical protein
VQAVGSQPLGTEMLRQYLNARQFKFSMDERERFRLLFSASEAYPVDLTIWLAAEGENHDILTMHCFCDRSLLDSEFDSALIACNRWNLEKRWPKAYCTLQPPWEVVLEMNVAISESVQAALVASILDGWMFGVHSFWQWIHAERILTPKMA